MTSLQIFRLITMAEAKEQRNGEFAVFVMTFPPFKPIRYQLSIAHEPSRVRCWAGSRLVWGSWVLAFWQWSWYSPPPVPASWLAWRELMSCQFATPSHDGRQHWYLRDEHHRFYGTLRGSPGIATGLPWCYSVVTVHGGDSVAYRNCHHCHDRGRRPVYFISRGQRGCHGRWRIWLKVSLSQRDCEPIHQAGLGNQGIVFRRALRPWAVALTAPNIVWIPMWVKPGRRLQNAKEAYETLTACTGSVSGQRWTAIPTPRNTQKTSRREERSKVAFWKRSGIIGLLLLSLLGLCGALLWWSWCTASRKWSWKEPIWTTKYRYNFYLHVCGLGCYEGEQRPNCLLSFAVQHHRHSDLVPEVPLMRSVVIKAVCTLAFYASYWRLVPLIYILVMFVAVPSICVAAGVVIFLALGAVRGFVWWSVWVGLQGDQGGKPRGVWSSSCSDGGRDRCWAQGGWGAVGAVGAAGAAGAAGGWP